SGFFDRRNSFGAGYTGEIFQKLRQRPPVLQIVCQGPKRNSRSAKDGFTAEDSKVADNDARGHFANRLPRVWRSFLVLRILVVRLPDISAVVLHEETGLLMRSSSYR